LTISYAPEYRHLGSNTNLLTELAQVTGGTFQPTPEEVLALGEDESIAIRKTLWPGLLMAALILFVLDVALRRLDLAGRGLFKDKTHRYG
jgi:hypothetical protein